LTADRSERARAFIDQVQPCISLRPDGRSEIDFDRVVAVVSADPQGAREYVELACREALSAPGFLAPAALIAEAYARATSDGTLVVRVQARRRAVLAAGEAEHPLRPRRP